MVRRSRSMSLALVAAVLALPACTNSAPPAAELADEMVDTLDVADSVKTCMKQEIAGFTLTEEEAKGFKDLDAVAAAAAGGQELAKQIIARFQAALADCNKTG